MTIRVPSFERGRDEKGLGERFTCLPMSEGLVSSDFHLRRQSLFGVAGANHEEDAAGEEHQVVTLYG